MIWGLIGFGSIGKRHAENIAALGDEVYVLTKNTDCSFSTIENVSELLDKKPDAIIIANETSKHYKSYEDVRKLNVSVKILIEKPIFDQVYLTKDDPHTYVAYCLRFHPLVLELKKRLEGKKILNSFFYVGQYLPDWRKGRDYRTIYSAHKDQGGGVLRDLSHELDLANYLLNAPLQLKFAQSTKVSDLEINSDDHYVGVFSTDNCQAVTISMNYLDKISQRFVIIITSEETYKLDLIKVTLTTNEKTELFEVDRNEMYIEMLKALKSGDKRLCSFEAGLHTLKIIDTSERNF